MTGEVWVHLWRMRRESGAAVRLIWCHEECTRIHMVQTDGCVLDAASDSFELDGRMDDTTLLSWVDTLLLPKRARTVRFTTTAVH